MPFDLREGPGERPFRAKELSNGLRVVVVPAPHLSRAHVGLYVRVGSRFEDEATNGISHFLEHMLYRGTPKLATAHEVNHAFESLGGYLYASTQADFGVFSVTMPIESLARSTELFGEVMREPTFADMEIEKEIVCEEILEDLDDDGRQIDADNLIKAMVYPAHPLGFTITGDEERVRSFTKEMCRAHHEKHYNAANSVLGFAGPIDPERAFELAERAFGAMPRGVPVTSPPPVHAQKKPRLKIVENVSSQTELRMSLRAVSEQSEHRAAMDMLLRILDDGMSTRLYHRICDDKGLCYDVSAQFDGYEDDGMLDFSAGCQHARTAIITKEILDLMNDLATAGPTEDELAKARRRNAWEFRAMLDAPDELAGFYAGGLLFERFETPEQRLAANSAVTRERLRALAEMITQPDRLNVVAVGLLDDGEDQRLGDVVRGFTGRR
jgi:predicted Zn-dependent peptidase